MNKSAIASGIVAGAVPFVLFLVFYALSTNTRKKAQFATPDDFCDREFRQPSWLAVMFGVLFLFAASGIIYGLVFKSQIWGLFVVGGGLFATIALAGLCDYWRSRVVVCGSRVMYSRLLSKTSFDLNEIRSVAMLSGMIVVDLGRIPRIVIPTLFRDSGVLLALLTYYRPNSKQTA